MTGPYLPPKIAVDAAGFYWRVVSDEAWSMCPTNPDNSPIPEPVTFYVPEVQPEAQAGPLSDVLTPEELDWSFDDPQGFHRIIKSHEALRAALVTVREERDAWERFARQLEPRAYLTDAGRGPGVMVG